MSPTLRLLILDDNPDDRALTLRELTREFPELQVIEVNHAHDLARALETGGIDIAILDYRIRWTNGLDVLRQLKQAWPDCPVIMFTATGSQEIAVEAMKSGLDDYVIKAPRHFVRLPAAVRSVLQQRRQRLALKEAEERYRSLFNGIPIGLFRCIPGGNILDANPAMVQLLGYPDAETLRSRGLEQLFVDPADRASWLEALHREGLVRNFETRMRRYDDTIIWGSLHTRAGPHGRDGSPLYQEGSLEDITGRKQAEAERAELLQRELAARNQAEQASRLKDEFLATISHELRTPLTALLGWIPLLRSGRLPASRVEHGLQIMERNGRALAQIIDDLLDVSRIIAGKLRLDLQLMHLPAVVSAALEAVQPAADARSIQVTLDLDAIQSPLLGDADRLQQVVWNLLSNAIKFTPPGGRVEVQLREEEGQAVLEVRDSGIGIDPAFVPFVFDRFRQWDGSISRRFGGLGLGLAIVRHLVEMHGGTVSAESPGSGQGATFSVRLPLAPLEVATVNAPASGSPAGADDPDSAPLPAGPSLSGLRVLLVDDEPDALEMLQLYLEQHDAEVRCATSAAEAYRLLDAWMPDVLVSDLSMPGESGLDLIRRIRARPGDQGGTLPAAAFTAHARAEDRARALAAGYQLHIPKPVNPAELVVVVACLAERRS